MKFGRWLALAFVLSTAQTLAWTSEGYMTGGGVGALLCPEFLNAMATARQAGGAFSPGGVVYSNPWVQYLLGYQTAFNATQAGIFDVFEELKPNHAANALYAIEAWCRDNPARDFQDGIKALIGKLHPGLQP